MQAKYWRSLESVPGLVADLASWREWLGQDFKAFSNFLQKAAGEELMVDGAKALPAITHQLSNHQLTINHQLPGHQPTWQLNRVKLGRALCSALGLDSRMAEFPLPFTEQIGSWSAQAVPAILTIQSERREFRLVVAELAARLRQRFILLAPTSGHVDAACQELLANVGAGFFALEGLIQLMGAGVFHPAKPPGELFARFTPVVEAREDKDKDKDEDVARKAFGLVKAMDSAKGARKISAYTVFRLYCVEGLSVGQVGRRCGCARSTIYERLEELGKTLGRHPSQMRRYSSHFEGMEESISDSRAKSVYRKGALGAGDEGEEMEG